MKVPQVANSRWRYDGAGDTVTFGRQVPRGLTIELDPGAGAAVEVRPGSVVSGAFRALELVFPVVVAAEDLDVFVNGRDGIWQLSAPALPQAFRVASSSVNLLASVTWDIALPPVADVTGAADALELYGAVQVTGTTGLPNAYLYWTSPAGNVLARWDRFTAVSALGLSHFRISSWGYPLPGGKLSITNGATGRTLKYDLFAVRK